jgi:hypothetical protein
MKTLIFRAMISYLFISLASVFAPVKTLVASGTVIQEPKHSLLIPAKNNYVLSEAYSHTARYSLKPARKPEDTHRGGGSTRPKI